MLSPLTDAKLPMGCSPSPFLKTAGLYQKKPLRAKTNTTKMRSTNCFYWHYKPQKKTKKNLVASQFFSYPETANFLISGI